jgi:predicted PurR-regulated permease PerM
MLGNLAISVICGTVYGVTAVILGLPYPLALAVIAGILDLLPNIGATLASVLAFGALFGLIGAIIGVPIAARAPDRRGRAHRRQKSSHRRRGRCGARAVTA